MQPITRGDALALFQLSGMPALNIWELAHSYYTFSPEEDESTTLKNARYRAMRPSWLVKTEFGLIELNLRKRVVEINWKDTGYQALDLGDGHPITTEDVTKDQYFVHAWDLVKATTYLAQLRQCLIKHRAEQLREQQAATIPRPPPSDITCKPCNGSGHTTYGRCTSCNGTGKT